MSAKTFRANTRSAWTRWASLSHTRQRDHVEAIEGAKSPETRARRIALATEMVKAAKRARS